MRRGDPHPAGVPGVRASDGVATIPPGAVREAVAAAVAAIDRSAAEGVDEATLDALAAVGRALGVDRSYLFVYDFDAGLCHNTHEWCGETIEPQIALLQGFPLHLMPEWVARHRAGEALDVADVFALPPDSGVRQTLEPQGIKSVTSVPLMDGTTCVGFVGFDAVRRHREFGAVDRAALLALAGALVRAYARLGRGADAHARSSATHDAVR